ncbi:MAG: DUF4238 domain-containing protein [Bacteroidia bacterium]|nr:DUF4238 domain-containing protein [Methylotenera sp.]
MKYYKKQHYVPIFLLKKWTNDKGLLSKFLYVHHKFEVTYRSPVQVGHKEKYLNFRYRKDLPSHYLESEINKKYDDEGAKVLEVLLTKGIETLTAEQEEQWSAFVASLLIRSPEIIDTRFRNKGEKFKALLNENPVEYEGLRNDEHPQSVADFVEYINPGYIADIGLTVIPNVVDIVASRIMNEMEWCVVNTQSNIYSFIIGDHPVILTAETTHPNCIVALPISPRHLFLASRPSVEWGKLMNITHQILVKAVNFETVTRANSEVYSLDERQKDFIKNHLYRN